jgi:drug/metabolite transporter (DMT)-like permease
MIVGAALVLVNYAALDRAYASGDLSLVYPVSRAGALVFLPAFGFVVFGERLSIGGGGAVALIIVGMLVLQLPALEWRAVRELGPRLRHRAVVYAMVAALAAAAYTIWDKRAVGLLPAFVYFYGYTALVAAAYVAFLWHRQGRARMRAEWRVHRAAIVQVGIFNTITYLLVLVALRGGISSYVIALRQLSIVWGVLLGRWILAERIGLARAAGIGLLVAGCVLVAALGR